MNKMSLKKGRINQKIKTRTSILNAAKHLMSKSTSITMEEVAQKAKVSRATMYRYFPNLELLYTEASLDVHHLSPDLLMEKVAHMPLRERIFFIQSYYNKLAQDHELIFRRYLSAVLKASIISKKKIRGARRVAAMQLILDAYKKDFSSNNLKNLKNIASILMGMEPLIVAKDVCDLSNEEANETLHWGLEMILKGMEIESK
ncbi:MAG: TetR/AcrR family transcriptional regulator [Croceitalea sp.]|nr:TetR/AcrR family transcriptional regulator [Croceitalea sp.]